MQHDPAFHHTARELDALPTLSQGQAADLKIDNNDGVRVWLHRTGIDDGETYENAISVERLKDGRWETVGEYDGGELDDDEPTYSKFSLEITMGNAAMRTPWDIFASDALGHVHHELADNLTSGKVHDSNGNTVGKWELT